ncbi:MULTISPECIES: hypothetical protein [unclassified Paenibacillus]|uniref:hypothetical protein n=1 Tax=unclassified Paenibacillus TaxID=185978 RepID=UPI001AEB0DE1|nr:MULTISPECIES: hypothetical protein [unclassified Paenibacillus]MBP1156474.1 formate-dependent nitrite reductase membrane component NrfD [Paenibacillus sp. PvP091]MBP1168140.1 formate-dependent nitrite reductase membrane component NrfD [Paenibacillus sp. PvR098]MBP2439168.1 formate-dependent nitrite reductase membrane component NrfD [Paenibacillus sp. PvP052]
MKRTDWIIAVALLLIGVSCLTLSSASLMKTEGIVPYLHSLFNVCMWIGTPIFIVGAIFLILKRRKGD